MDADGSRKPNVSPGRSVGCHSVRSDLDLFLHTSPPSLFHITLPRPPSSRVLKCPETDQVDAASSERGKLRPKVIRCARHSTGPGKSRFSLRPSLTSSTTRPSGCPSAPTSKYTSGFWEEEFAPRAPPSLQVRVVERRSGAERGPESRPSRRGPQRRASIAVTGRARARGRTQSRHNRGRTTQEAIPVPSPLLVRWLRDHAPTRLRHAPSELVL